MKANKQKAGVRQDRRTSQYIPTVDGKDVSPTSFDKERAMQIAEQTANTTQKAVGHTAGVYFERRPVALPIRRSMHGSAKFLDSFGNPLDANQEEWLVEFVNTSAKLFSSYPEGLISQAPAMLEAFEELTNEASDNLENIGLPHDKAMLMLALIDNARATIARAKGEVQS